MATKTIFFSAFAALSFSTNGAEPQFVEEKSLAEGKIDIRPEFPAQAQAQRMAGAGVFVLHVSRNSGRVTSVEVERSTGHKILDNAAVVKFTNLQFKPQTVARVTIPVEFRLPPPGDSITRARGYPAMVLYMNERPVLPSHGRTGGK